VKDDLARLGMGTNRVLTLKELQWMYPGLELQVTKLEQEMK
jgi:hypothetical protein